jgi:hypothetical protein
MPQMTNEIKTGRASWERCHKGRRNDMGELEECDCYTAIKVKKSEEKEEET